MGSPAISAYAIPCGIRSMPTVIPAERSWEKYFFEYLGSQESIGNNCFSTSQRYKVDAEKGVIKKRAASCNSSRCPERESNPHALTDTWPSTMPVYQFQHLGSAIKRVPMTPFFFVTPLGLEPRTLSLKVRCSNQLS